MASSWCAPRRQFSRFPVVDWAALEQEAGPSYEHAVETIGQACSDLGFFQLVDSRGRWAAKDVEHVRTAAQAFFARHEDYKATFKLVYGENRLLSGYSAVGAEKADVANYSLTGKEEFTDLMESYQLADLPLISRLNEPPVSVPSELSPALPPLFDSFHQIGLRLLHACGVAYGVADASRKWVDMHSREDKHRTVLRVTRYPALKHVLKQKDNFSGQITRISPHRDLGTLTLLSQDQCGGLEVLDPRTNEWFPVDPIEGALVVNVGNLLQRSTNDSFRSSIHRVVPSANAEEQDRYSVIMFMNPCDHTTLEPLLASTLPPSVAGSLLHYSPINVGEYIDCKLEQLFNPQARDEKGTCEFDD